MSGEVAEVGGGKKNAGGPPKGSHNARKHGLYSLQLAVRELGKRAVDGRTRLGRLVADLRESIIADLGGKESISQAQSILIDDVARLTLWIDSIDAYLITLASIVNKRKRMLFPVAVQRNAFVETRARLLQALGLERRAKKALTLADIIAEYAEKDAKAAQTPAGVDTGSAPAATPETPASPSADASRGIGDDVTDAEPRWKA